MLFSILGIMLGVSCSDSDDEMGDEGDGGTTATTPFKSVQVEADGEKVQGADRKSTRLNSSHKVQSRMPSSA